MNTQAAKKLKKLYRKQLEAEAQKKVGEWGRMIKPKPKYCPHFIYRLACKLVLK